MQLTTPLILLATSAAAVLAAPHPGHPHQKPHTSNTTTTPYQHPYTLPTAQNPLNITIHPSCSAPSAIHLHHALGETHDLLSNAISHLLTHGSSSPLYTKFFGSAPSAEPLGWLTRLASSTKSNATLLRCDDPDGNCARHPTSWAGHWRGSNATEETVICPLSFQNRRPLEQVCQGNYSTSAAPLNAFFAVDLVHRFFHLPSVAEGVVDHFADGYDEVLELAKSENQTLAGRNTNTLQWFALEAWAWDVAAPGVGCDGLDDEDEDEDEDKEPTTTTSSVVVTATSTAPKDCHTHADGVVHCD